MVCTCYIYDIVEFFIKKIIQHYYATKKKQTKQDRNKKCHYYIIGHGKKLIIHMKFTRTGQVFQPLLWPSFSGSLRS